LLKLQKLQAELTLHSAYELYAAAIADKKRGAQDNGSSRKRWQWKRLFNVPHITGKTSKVNPEKRSKDQERVSSNVGKRSEDPEERVSRNTGKRSEDPEEICKQFKRSLSRKEVKVHFVGVW
jgi:hypothetical protein